MKKAGEFNNSFNRRTVVINSFFGLEKPIAMPPNFVVTGPLTKPQGDLLSILKQKDEALFDWMNAAETDNVPVVYISIGSECKWKQWSIDVLYQGLKELGCKVIWSLKNPDDMFKMPEENPNFWIRAWIPQIEVLAHPAMKAGLTHCGMGGTLEFISMGVPAVLFPHCGDQHTNAANLRNAGAAVTLHDKVRLSKNFGDVISY